LQSRANVQDQADEVRGLLDRLIPNQSHLFSIQVQPDSNGSLDKVETKARFKIIDSHRGREVAGHPTPGVSTAEYLFSNSGFGFFFLRFRISVPLTF